MPNGQRFAFLPVSWWIQFVVCHTGRKRWDGPEDRNWNNLVLSGILSPGCSLCLHEIVAQTLTEVIKWGQYEVITQNGHASQSVQKKLDVTYITTPIRCQNIAIKTVIENQLKYFKLANINFFFPVLGPHEFLNTTNSLPSLLHTT